MKHLRTIGHLVKYLFLQESRSVQSLFWMLLFPVFLLILFGFIFGEEGFREGSVIVGVDPVIVEEVGGNIEIFQEGRQEAITFTEMMPEEGKEALLENTLYAYITRDPGEREYRVLITERYKQFSFLLSSILDRVNVDFYKEKFRGRELFPYALEVVSFEGRSYSYVYYLLAGIVGISLMMNCFFALPQIIITYRNQGFLKRFIFSPLSKFDFTISLIIERAIIGILQIVILAIAARLIFDVRVLINPGAFLLVYCVGAAAFGVFGFFLAGVLHSIEASAAVAQILNMLFMFTGGIFLPLEMMPPFFARISKVNPVLYLSHGVNATMLMGRGIGDIRNDLLILAGIFGVFMVVTVFSFRYNRKL